MDARVALKSYLANTISLSDEQFEYVFSHFKYVSFKKGQVVITEGGVVNCEYFVVSGCLKSFYINDQLKMFILQFGMENWWASDYHALYNGGKATINIDCVTDAGLLCITSEDREKLCAELHIMEYFFRWRTNKGYAATQKKLVSFMNNDARHRYEELMKQYPELYNLVPKNLIAAYLGVSRETLSRLYNS